MKSIMEEASSIFKAVENGWIKAGKPKEFSIKIYEEPERNFIGLVTKSAKIGIFFDDALISKNVQEQSPKKKQVAPESKPRVHEVKATQEHPKPKMQRNAPIFNLEPKEEKAQTTKPQTQAQEQTKILQAVWTDSMLENVQKWVNETLNNINISNTFNITTQNFSLRINFDKPVYEDKNREKQFFASLSTLLLQMLKHRYRRPLKGYKIIILANT